MLEIRALDSVSTEELISEICKRCTPAIFIGTKNEGKQEGNVSFYEAKGNPATCYGMCHELAFNILQDMIKKQVKEE